MAKEKEIEEMIDNEEDLEINDYSRNTDITLKTHEKTNQDLCGEIEKLEIGYVKLKLVTTHDMVVDSLNLIHGGFIFGAADFAAMAAVNEKNVVLVASECQFLSPVKFGDIVSFIAKVRHKEGRKRNVNVVGYVLDIKVFDGEFKTVVTDRHVLKLKLTEPDSGNE